MDQCPKCGYVEEECEVAGCHQPAEWEGWWRVVGPFGIPTGLIQLRRVCKEHTTLLMGQAEDADNT